MNGVSDWHSHVRCSLQDAWSVGVAEGEWRMEAASQPWAEEGPKCEWVGVKRG